ncbi:1,4-dihydroxy-6-naphthoate synthase [Desulfacinum hydrothermale DSM 13146]|uniref:1,4-dihydroxy-6-naphtoate synthase n=1 Tax=Desulfacinum hydrothermale DSM 13146 TaxID=1121390 RepID=A0A1W1WYF1_9BACT|nr:1,4-dihydroxy-6-naphthoate synthase [Desulfacinum hydrothermale]SMC16141.1 1,4-dihydroxy-6-naphthoate synthase [Desulfacinum hydrothermale DSM 13146]
MDRPLSLGYSPCPNDTFIFSGIALGRVPGSQRVSEPFLADVEVLNQKARQGELDVTKISFNALVHCLDHYWLLRSGGALGRGCGPLLVTGKPCTLEDLRRATVAIPGRLTTANLLLELLGACQGPRVEMSFEQVMPAVASGAVEAGVVIHEGRFTYEGLGLHLALDLGAWWEETTGLPLPLGCIVIRRDLGREAARRMDEAIVSSLDWARRHEDEAWPYIRRHAQEMDPQVIHRHIETFVNDFSRNVGPEGEQAIRRLLEQAARAADVKIPDRPLFWDSQEPRSQ